jgi:nucleotide-binding universal stress UspA family protein
MRNTDSNHPVVVGVDFSPEATTAVALGAFEAESRRVPLVLVSAIDPTNTPSTVLAYTLSELIADAERELDTMAKAVAKDHPSLEIHSRVAQAAPTQALLDASAQGSLVVLCSRGKGGFSQLLLGSIAWRVTSRARGPVLLVRPGTELPAEFRNGPVLVGVDGSNRSTAAIDFAFREASLRRTSLVAVNVWGLPYMEGLNAERVWSTESAAWLQEMGQDAERTLSEALAGTGTGFPEVNVERVVRHGLNVPDTLLAVAAEHQAALVVVGAGGHHSLAELAIGAVGVQLSHHADRPVAVVHCE